MILGQFRPMMKSNEEEFKSIEKPPESQRSGSSEDFIKTPDAQKLIKEWSNKKDGKPTYTKRGVSALLMALFQVPGLKTNKEIINTARDVLSKLSGMDGLQGFLMGWKAKSEGIMKGLKSILG